MNDRLAAKLLRDLSQEAARHEWRVAFAHLPTMSLRVILHCDGLLVRVNHKRQHREVVGWQQGVQVISAALPDEPDEAARFDSPNGPQSTILFERYATGGLS